MTEAEQFFYDHDFWSEGADKTYRAEQLANAEVAAREHKLTFRWEPDPSLEGRLRCSVLSGGDVIATVGEIRDPTPEYLRVTEAELAWLAVSMVARSQFAMP